MLGQSILISYHTEANGYIFFAAGVPSKSMLFKWVNDKDEKGMNNILRRAYEGCNLKKYRPVPKKNPKHAKTHELLYKEHLEHRKRGNKISFYWYYITGKKIAAKNSLPPFTK